MARNNFSTALYCLSACLFLSGTVFAAEEKEQDTAPLSRVRLYTRQLDAKNEIPQAYAGRALAYAELGEDKKAWQDVESALKLSPKLPQAFKARAELRLRAGQLDEALADFSKVVRLAPALDAYLDRARAYAELGMFDDAVRDCDLAQRLESSTRPAYLRARLYTRQGRYDKMYEEFDALVSRNPGDPIALNNRGYAALWIGKWQRAKEDMLKAISIEKNYPAAYVNLADYYWAKAASEKPALEHLEKAFETGYTNFDSLTDENRDGHFLKGLTEKDSFRRLVEKYKGKK